MPVYAAAKRNAILAWASGIATKKGLDTVASISIAPSLNLGRKVALIEFRRGWPEDLTADASLSRMWRVAP